MSLDSLSTAQLQSRLRRGEINLDIGPFSFRIRSDIPRLAELLKLLYCDYSLSDDDSFADFHVALLRSRGVRRWWHPRAQFQMDRQKPFDPLPLDTAFPFLEWGFNWCVATRAHQYLLLHAGVIEINGVGVLLPAWPGSGKSTLCAAACTLGWRMLSDEFGLVELTTHRLKPFPRPIAIKNEALPVVRRFAPDMTMGPEFSTLRKGTIAHLRPSRLSVANAHEASQARLIVFPNFQRDADLELQRLPKERAFLKLSGNSFNYESSGLRGFEAVAGLVEHCDCYVLEYGDSLAAMAALEELATGLADAAPVPA